MKTKKTIIAFAIMAAMQTGCAAEDALHVAGNMSNTGDTLLVFTAETQNAPQTVIVKNGKFDFQFKLQKVDIVHCASPAAVRGQQGAHIAFVGVPGEHVTFNGQADNFEMGGSQFYQDYNVLNKAMNNTKNKQQALVSRCTDMMKNGAPEDSVLQIFQQENQPIVQEMENTIANFIRTNSHSDAAAAAIVFMPPQKMREAAALLSDNVRNGRMKTFYQKAIDNYEAQQQAEQQAGQLQAEGRPAPDFTLTDINGRPLALSSLRGKYVVLDFWGSWCGWCIKGFPQMKEYYNKYRGKFEIVGIDCNDPEQKWRDAVKKHQLPWLHVYSPRDSRVPADYGIQGFPTKIIISPDGKIVKTIVGEDPQFYTLLDQLFGGQ